MERILLVEDDAQITASLSAFLQSEGFSVETATGERFSPGRSCWRRSGTPPGISSMTTP